MKLPKLITERLRNDPENGKFGDKLDIERDPSGGWGLTLWREGDNSNRAFHLSSWAETLKAAVDALEAKLRNKEPFVE
jgi:hypothetical protein